MLRQRVITALVLLALMLPALFARSPWPFALFTLVAISAAGWEWARLNGAAGALPAVASGVLLGLACAAGTGLLGPQQRLAPGWSVALARWVVGGAWVLRRGPAGWPLWPVRLRWALGLGLLWLAWLALAQARVIGIHFLLSVLCVVWMADIAAYFSGRAFGKRKLAPSISPGKSWEGVWGGAAGVLLLAAVWLWAEPNSPFWTIDSPSIFKLMLQRYGALGLVAASLLLTALSVTGDLFESLVKRAAGVKDSSGLLPGHGGVLDRVDALLPVLPAAMALVTF
ncbi:MAG: phosphatidate cytidylyltransferase [Burkholderiales bacterium PBB5]|nr:MAG: phosphatidate cytidylyltransferase [Burkholderiales bacterium PBB5]